MSSAFIGTGSNINPGKNIEKAIRLLLLKVFIRRISTFYKTLPVERPEQPAYYNGVLMIETDVPPYELKYSILRKIEAEIGRKRSTDKFAARLIDLDLLLYDHEVIHNGKLDIPDPEIMERPFIAIPLFELFPALILPEFNIPIRKIAERFDGRLMRPLLHYTEILRRIIENGQQKN